MARKVQFHNYVHKWQKFLTVIGVIYECRVCRTWTKKRERLKINDCIGKEIR